MSGNVVLDTLIAAAQRVVQVVEVRQTPFSACHRLSTFLFLPAPPVRCR